MLLILFILSDYYSRYEFNVKEAKEYYRDWVARQSPEVRKMVGVIGMDILIDHCKSTKRNASTVVESFVGTSERTLRKYRSQFYTEGEVRRDERGGNLHHALAHAQHGEVKEEAIRWLRKETGRKNSRLTVTSFCRWVNNTLIPAHPEFSTQRISRVTAWRWMHALGFKYSKYQKGYVDGHERVDVVEERVEYISKLEALESSHLPPPPPSDMEAYDIGKQDAERKLVLIYHDESTFHAHEGRSKGWSEKGKQPLLPKGRGRGLMISDFVDEHNGFLQLTEEEHKQAKRELNDNAFPRYSREVLEYGAEHEGYWNNKMFIKQVKKAARIASFKYPEDTHNVIWIFDQSSNHRAYSEDALVARKMNVKPEGSQPKLRSTPIVVNGRPFVQHMVDANGEPKGMRQVLKERGIDTRKMKKEDMIKELNKWDDFKNEKSQVEKELARFGHRVLFLPKYHPELNPIERVWGRVKVYTRDHCDYTFTGLQNTIVPAFNSVTPDLIRKYFRKSRDYVRAYQNGHTGLEADEVIKEYKSHRRVPEVESMQ